MFSLKSTIEEIYAGNAIHADMRNYRMYSSPKPTDPHTTPFFIMRKHSARTSENLGLLINITVVHYGNAHSPLPTYALSAAPSSASANSSRDLGTARPTSATS